MHAWIRTSIRHADRGRSDGAGARAVQRERQVLVAAVLGAWARRAQSVDQVHTMMNVMMMMMMMMMMVMMMGMIDA